MSSANVEAVAESLERRLLPNGVRTRAFDVTDAATRKIRSLTLDEYDELLAHMRARIAHAEQMLSDLRYLDGRIRELSGAGGENHG